MGSSLSPTLPFEMVNPDRGPFLFDTSAESWLGRSEGSETQRWMREYLCRHAIHVSALTVLVRIRGYALLWRRATEDRRASIEAARIAYLANMREVAPLDEAIALVAGEIMALLPEPPSPPRRTHRATESRQERLARWRFDAMIAASALVTRLVLVHNNALDFEAIRAAIERAPERFPNLGPLELIRCGSLV